MANVLFKRGNNDTLKNTPFLDGLVFFNEENHRIYMDNGNKRYQYGGDTAIISNPELATEDTVMSAKSTLDLFAQKRSVVDKVSDALAVTENNIPVGCLAFRDLYTDINNNVERQLSANNRRVDDLEDMMDVRTDDNQIIHIYFQQHNGKIGYNTDIKRGADTFIPFKNLEEIKKYLPKSLHCYASGSGSPHNCGGSSNISIIAPADGTLSMSISEGARESSPSDGFRQYCSASATCKGKTVNMGSDGAHSGTLRIYEGETVSLSVGVANIDRSQHDCTMSLTWNFD
jgi:hypothetical protein